MKNPVYCIQRAFCNDDCATTVPQAPGTGCTITTRKGGMKRLVFAACDYTFVDITDLVEWQAALLANKIHASGEILGSKPKGSFTKKKVASCRPEQVVGGEKVINFSDYNADLAAFTDYDFWNQIFVKQLQLVFGYLDCDDNFYGFIPNWSLEIDDTREEDVKGNTFFEGVITYESTTMQKPIYIPGLNNILN